MAEMLQVQIFWARLKSIGYRLLRRTLVRVDYDLSFYRSEYLTAEAERRKEYKTALQHSAETSDAGVSVFCSVIIRTYKSATQVKLDIEIQPG